MSRREDREAGPAEVPDVVARLWADGTYAQRVYHAGRARRAHRAISRIIRREERRQRRCWRHEDCREDHELGAHCYAMRRCWPWAKSATCQGECCVGPVRVLQPLDMAALTRVMKQTFPAFRPSEAMYGQHPMFAMVPRRR